MLRKIKDEHEPLAFGETIAPEDFMLPEIRAVSCTLSEIKLAREIAEAYLSVPLVGTLSKKKHLELSQDYMALIPLESRCEEILRGFIDDEAYLIHADFDQPLGNEGA